MLRGLPGRVLLLVALGILLPPAGASAVTLTFEGIAGPGIATSEDDITRTWFTVYDVRVNTHGHYIDVNYASNFAYNGTDWITGDHPDGITITRNDAQPFSIQRFDAAEWTTGYSGGGTISISATPFGGGAAIQTTFTFDASPADAQGPNQDFETFTFGPAFASLASITFTSPDRYVAYDNVVLEDAAAAVPEPTLGALLAIGAAAGILPLRRRARAARSRPANRG